MFASRRRVYPALFIFAIGLGAGAARADDASNQQMQQKIDQLESKVEALEAQENQAQNQTPSQAKPDNATTMNNIVSGADSQSQLMAPMPGGSGYDPATGFHISSDDGNFYLHPWALAQFRGVINDRQSIQSVANGGKTLPASGSQETDGFEIHNLYLGVDGHVVTPNLQYFLDMNVPSSGGGETLQDAYVTYRLGDNCPWTFKAGQFVDPVWHESNVDDGHLLLVDRSLVGVLLGGNTGLNNGAERVQGVGIAYDSDFIRGEFDFTDGYNTANTPFFNTAIGGIAGIPATDFGMSGRVEVKVLGDATAWDGYDSLSSKDDKSDSVILGGGFEWTEAANLDNIYLTVDGQYSSPKGLNIYAGLLENYAAWSDNGQPPQSALNQAVSGTYPNFGFIAQAGFMLNPQWEPFVRYDLAILNSRFADVLAFGNKNPAAGTKATANNHEITVGVNYYLFGYRAKVAGDLSFLPNGSAVDAPGLAILANQNHSEWVGRVQFQLSI
jgi:hypothetical protein